MSHPDTLEVEADILIALMSLLETQDFFYKFKKYIYINTL